MAKLKESRTMLFLLCFISVCCSMTVQLSSLPFCIQFDGNSQSTLTFVASGEEEENKIHCTVMQDNNILYDEVTDDGSFKHAFAKSTVQVCFAGPTSKTVRVSFDFYSQDDPIRSMIEKKDLKEVEGALAQTHMDLMDVFRNQQFQIQRDEEHKRALEESEDSIKIAGFIKLVILLGSAFVQLWIMKGLFAGGQPYQPVELM